MHCAALATAPNSACLLPPMTFHSSRPNHVQTRFTRPHNAVYPTYRDTIVQGPTLSQWRNQDSFAFQNPIRTERKYAQPALSAYYPRPDKAHQYLHTTAQRERNVSCPIHPNPMLSCPNSPTQTSSHAHGQCSSIFLSLYRCAPFVQYIHF